MRTGGVYVQADLYCSTWKSTQEALLTVFLGRAQHAARRKPWDHWSHMRAEMGLTKPSKGPAQPVWLGEQPQG